MSGCCITWRTRRWATGRSAPTRCRKRCFAHGKCGSLRSQDHFKAWMVRILLNTIADGKRRGKLPTTALSDTLPAEERPDNLPLYEALRALPEGMRYAVVLVYLDGCTMRECAKMLRVPEGTVKSRLSRAKALLRDYLSEEA
ncbi:MAG: RNA polymerase sigma factor [Christensenellales bacterium]